jgi:hypothetical protein
MVVKLYLFHIDSLGQVIKLFNYLVSFLFIIFIGYAKF